MKVAQSALHWPCKLPLVRISLNCRPMNCSSHRRRFLVPLRPQPQSLRAWSTLVTSNLPFQVDRVLGSERLTGRAAGPPHHHVHILEMNGESYRLKQSKHKRNPHPGLLNHHYISRRSVASPLRPKNGPQTGPRASPPDATLTAKPHPPPLHLV